jgi:hypothetical protein
VSLVMEMKQCDPDCQFIARALCEHVGRQCPPPLTSSITVFFLTFSLSLSLD